MQTEHHSKTKTTIDNNEQSLLQFNTICNLCSIGCSLKISHNENFILKVEGKNGIINANGEYCNYPENGFKNYNKIERLTSPLLKQNGKFIQIPWEHAFEIVSERLSNTEPSESAFFAGARLTNEEQFLIMKLCRAGAQSNNIGSFHYLGRGTSYTKLSRANIPFAELVESKKIFIIGAEVTRDHPVAAQYIINCHNDINIPIHAFTTDNFSELASIADELLIIKSYFHFIKAVNYLVISRGLEDRDYINNLVDNFEKYKQSVLSCDFAKLVEESGTDLKTIEYFTENFCSEPHAVIVFSENILSGHTCSEIFNLALLTGKHGRSGAGLMLLKENNNSHGLHDMGVMWNLGPGAVPWDDPFQRSTAQFIWGTGDLPIYGFHALQKLRDKGYESLFIFGEDPIGCALNQQEIKQMLRKSTFIAVQDYFMTPTAEVADLILPASFSFETGGTYTNSQRVIQKVDRRMKSPLTFDSWKQSEELLARKGFQRYESIDDVTFEIASLLPKFCTSSKLMFRINSEDNLNLLFSSGSDAWFKNAKEN